MDHVLFPIRNSRRLKVKGVVALDYYNFVLTVHHLSPLVSLNRFCNHPDLTFLFLWE